MTLRSRRAEVTLFSVAIKMYFFTTRSPKGSNDLLSWAPHTYSSSKLRLIGNTSSLFKCATLERTKIYGFESFLRLSPSSIRCPFIYHFNRFPIILPNFHRFNLRRWWWCIILVHCTAGMSRCFTPRENQLDIGQITSTLKQLSHFHWGQGIWSVGHCVSCSLIYISLFLIALVLHCFPNEHKKQMK